MTFNFKHFSIEQNDAVLKVGTDAFVLGAFFTAHNPKRILDIGAGTGVLSLIAAQKFTNALIDAVEIDEESSVLAQRNFENSPWANRLVVHKTSIQDFSTSQNYDLIVSNPPFFENSSAANSEVNNRVKHNGGLSATALIESIYKNLDAKGVCWLILSADFMTTYYAAIQALNLHVVKEIEVFGKPNVLKRKILVLRKEKGEVEKEQFTIRDEKGKYSAEYIALTKDLHDRAL